MNPWSSADGSWIEKWEYLQPSRRRRVNISPMNSPLSGKSRWKLSDALRPAGLGIQQQPIKPTNEDSGIHQSHPAENPAQHSRHWKPVVGGGGGVNTENLEFTSRDDVLLARIACSTLTPTKMGDIIQKPPGALKTRGLSSSMQIAEEFFKKTTLHFMPERSVSYTLKMNEGEQIQSVHKLSIHRRKMHLAEQHGYIWYQRTLQNTAEY
ncbi:hypothetical protein CIHG_07551 [Coccidioides immitis H538.4]|uniref:Uncharacterized protein n=3 Tax=Coccidioides immitis TaxID=5501 RepID=A0A0J8R570_COCIT|nr:hypothetical protein CIRG_07841 [Coccidioides immitis RMSCC 2394]KMU79560.1 hypothetical protein CISG_01978 [Coccidioides immitis RMSCC 3703]KMU89868.1 hypothetical protein CIHG_07551 [Coccidioides immitis H538.4]